MAIRYSISFLSFLDCLNQLAETASRRIYSTPDAPRPHYLHRCTSQCDAQGASISLVAMAPTTRPQKASTKRPARKKALSTRSSPTVFRCTYAGEYRCDETFKSQAEAFSHAILSHGVAPFRKTEDGQYICPLAKGFGCTTILHSLASLGNHLKSMHQGEGCSCLIAEVHGCTSKFTTVQGVTLHVNSVHRKRRYPCPWAEKQNCTATFASYLPRTNMADKSTAL